MFDPEADLLAIWRILSADDELLNLLGYVSGKPLAEFVWKGDQFPKALGGRLLCFYHAPSRTSANELVTQEVIQFDAYAPIANPDVPRKVIARVVEIVKKHRFNGHKLYFSGQLGQLPAPSGYTCAAVRFVYPVVI